MRTDLTTAFSNKKNASFREPIQLLVFKFASGNVYASDREITVGSNTYQRLVEDWGELTEAVDAEESNSSEVRQCTVTLWNGGASPFSDRFLEEDPENVEVELYQFFNGLDAVDLALIDRFIISDPIEFDEASRLLRIDLVSINTRYDALCSHVLSFEEFPYALDEHIGRGFPLLYGDCGIVPTICAKTAPKATLNGSIAKTSTVISVNENLDTKGFPASGMIQIEEEVIQYSSRSTYYFTASVRGYSGTTKEAHPHNCEVHQLITDHTYIAGKTTSATINAVYVGGKLAPSGICLASVAGGYAKVIFSQKPYYVDFSASVTIQEEVFDVTTASNTAWQAFYAYDSNAKTSSAMINEVYPQLAIEQTTGLKDKGAITTAYLAVTHWETNIFTTDYVEVWVEGIGIVGRLSKPSQDDIFQIEAEVDIDHEQEHVTGDTHSHTLNNPSYSANVGFHAHPLTGSGQTINVIAGGLTFPAYRYNPPIGWFESLNQSYSWNDPGTPFTSGYIKVVGIIATVDLALVQGGVTLKRWYGSQTYSINEEVPLYTNPGTGGDIYFQVWGTGGPSGSYARIDSCNMVINYASDMGDSRSAVEPVLSTSGSNQDFNNLNNPDDVYPLLTDNREIEILSKKNPARTIIDKFDLSDYITASWDWFKNREIRVVYRGTANDVNVFISNVVFEIEYRKRIIVYSDEVSVNINANPANSPEEVMQELLVNVAGLPSAYVDTVSFASAASRFSSLGYEIDGVIDAGLTVREAIKKVTFQTRSRLFWNAGKVKIAVREKQADLSPAKSITTSGYQQKSIKVRRQKIADIVNYIQLFYKIDLSSADIPYSSSVLRQNIYSISQHGQRENRGKFCFDLVKDDSMAADLADFYIENLSYPSTFYEFASWLNQFELEKEDCIELTSSGFGKLRKIPLVIRAANRRFGSGKNKVINQILFVAESIRYILLTKSLSDNIIISDALTVEIGKLLDFADSIAVTDEINFECGAGFDDEITVSDALEILFKIAETINETVTVSDALAAGLSVTIEETVRILDQAQAWKQVGFGSSDFGLIGFGGITQWLDSNPDEVVMVDELKTSVACNLSETITVSESLVASNGFGSSGSYTSGFGVIPFGQ